MEVKTDIREGCGEGIANQLYYVPGLGADSVMNIKNYLDHARVVLFLSDAQGKPRIRKQNIIIKKQAGKLHLREYWRKIFLVHPFPK